MKAILTVALRSAWSRRGTLALVCLSVALSSFLLLGVERLRQDVRENFAQSVSGTDLIVGARGGSLQLLLYAVFRIGGATNNVRLSSLEEIARHRAVAWMVPLSLGDSHRGFPVLATTPGYFEHFRYGDKQPLQFAEGRAFGGDLSGLYDVVLGAEVAERLGYRAGDRLTLSHGGSDMPGAEHADKPFTVVGILAPSATPLDRAVLVSLEGLEAIHVDWHGGAPIPGLKITPEQVRKFDLRPKSVTAALVGLHSRSAVFRVQRQINAYAGEPLTAILPGATLQQLWDLVGIAERALLAVSALVVVVGLTGMVAVVLASLGERRRELAILRALGASPREVFALLALESLLLATAGIALGLGLLYGAGAALAPWLAAQHGLQPSLGWPAAGEWRLLGAVLAASLVASLLPGLRAYRQSLADGMTVRT